MKDINYRALEWCIYRRVPFCLFRLPGDKEERFYSAPSLLEHDLGQDNEGEDAEGFFICEFAGRKRLHIPFECDADETVRRRFKMPANTYTDPPLCTADTERDEYMQKVEDLIGTMRREGSSLKKVVISVVRTEPMLTLTPADMVDTMLDDSPGCMVHCYYHPLTGFWMGATPELLLSANLHMHTFRTMALAATDISSGKWVEKDVSEHNIVASYIEHTLGAMHLKYKASPTKDMQYGCLVHRRTDFRGSLRTPGGTDVDPLSIVEALHPTPALAGYPLNEALDRINAIESHPRRCYGGYVGVRTANSVDAYVNIRCCNFDSRLCTFYTGGGILPDSIPVTEWLEAMYKRHAVMEKMGLE